jgi:hypothetical protein
MPNSRDATSTSEQPQPSVIHTDGGDYAEGDIDKRQGTFVGRCGNSATAAGVPYPALRAPLSPAEERGQVVAGSWVGQRVWYHAVCNR